MKPTDLVPNAIVEIEVTGYFTNRETALKFPGIDPNNIKIGPPAILDGQILVTDAWGRFVILRRVHTRQ